MAYQPIQDHGIIGDLHTVALVGMDGSIDWFCFPNFDSPSVFAAILDDAKGGRFRIAPTCEATRKQFYQPDTNVLITRFLAAEGVGQVTDFMPVGLPSDDPHRHQLVRRVQVVRGSMEFRMDCQPAFNYARTPHATRLVDGGACFDTPDLSLGLSTTQPLERAGSGVTSTFALREGHSSAFVLGQVNGHRCEGLLADEAAAELVSKTAHYWRQWLGQCTYQGRWREIVHRSALVLKLMTFEPTGAIVAAPTCSLPEGIGGERNWDYRYTWIRDAAFTLYALMRIGFTEAAGQFMHWIENRCHELNPDNPLQIMYGIDGRHDLTEETLDHLDGYMSSRPVRIGNGAHKQLQLDIYGELMDSVYLYNKYGAPISYDLWRHLRRLVDWVCDNWRRQDEGLWEVRGSRRHFVYSKLMCWVAIDRGLRLANKRSFPADRVRWMAVRDEIYEEIMARGWSESRQAFVQHYGHRVARRIESDDAVGLFSLAGRPAQPWQPRRHDGAARQGRAHGQQPRLSVQPQRDGRRAFRQGGHVQRLHVLAGRSAHAGRSSRSSRVGQGPSDLRGDARLRQPYRAVRRGNGTERRGSRQFSPGAHAPGSHQRRLQPRPDARHA